MWILRIWSAFEVAVGLSTLTDISTKAADKVLGHPNSISEPALIFVATFASSITSLGLLGAAASLSKETKVRTYACVASVVYNALAAYYLLTWPGLSRDMRAAGYAHTAFTVLQSIEAVVCHREGDKNKVERDDHLD